MYVGICENRGKTVSDTHALGYAVNQIMTDEKEQKEFLEWFYSGNWIKEECEDGEF